MNDFETKLHSSLTDELFILDDWGQVYEGRLEMQHEKTTYRGGICFCLSLLMPSSIQVEAVLCEEEKNYFDTLLLEKRKLHYLIGRYAAKRAVSLITSDFFIDISIGYGVFNNPIIDRSLKEQERLNVSISHCGDVGAAITFPDAHPMAIDVEKVVSDKVRVIKNELTVSEIKLLGRHFGDTEKALSYTLAWTIKESLSKALKTGLTNPFMFYEILSISRSSQMVTSYFKHFKQYKAVSFLLGEYVCSITLPKKTECEFNIEDIRNDLCLPSNFNLTA